MDYIDPILANALKIQPNIKEFIWYNPEYSNKQNLFDKKHPIIVVAKRFIWT